MIEVAVIDSGIDGAHPALRGKVRVAVGPGFLAGAAAAEPSRGEDLLGHGTAVAATMLRAAERPDVSLLSLRVFAREPVCDFLDVLRALAHAIDAGVHLVNLSLGTTSLRHRSALLALVERARQRQVRIVAPASYGGLPCDPGNLPGVEAVVADPNVLPTLPELRRVGDRFVWFASPMPPPDADGIRRLLARGDSLAVAAVTGCLLRSMPR